MDAVVVHSEHGAARLRELGIENVHVIPHGAFDALAAVDGRAAVRAAAAGPWCCSSA